MPQTVIKNNYHGSQSDSTSGRQYYEAMTNETIFLKKIYIVKDLKKYKLKSDLLFEEKYEDGEFVLSSDFLNLYANGETLDEAHSLLIDRIEDLYEDLNSDDRYSKKFLKIKEYLDRVIDAKR